MHAASMMNARAVIVNSFFFSFSFLILSRHWMLVASCVCIQCMEFGLLNYFKVREHESICMSPRYSFSCCLSVLSSHSHGKFNVNGRSKCRICFHPKAFTSYYTDHGNCQTPYNLMNRTVNYQFTRIINPIYCLPCLSFFSYIC